MHPWRASKYGVGHFRSEVTKVGQDRHYRITQLVGLTAIDDEALLYYRRDGTVRVPLT